MTNDEYKLLSQRFDQQDELLRRHDRALFGEDGRGGLVDVVNKIGSKMSLLTWIAAIAATALIGRLVTGL